MWAFDHYCRHLSDSETTGQKESLWQIGPPEHKWEIFVSYRKHHLVDSPYTFIASYCCIKQHLSLIITGTLQIIFKLSQKHSMCQVGESPDNECQYHYHNFNVAIFHPLTTQTFVFETHHSKIISRNGSSDQRSNKMGRTFFFHTRRAATFGIRVPIPIVEMTSVWALLLLDMGQKWCKSFSFWIWLM